jgi:autotransporter-associated beta strand protein
MPAAIVLPVEWARAVTMYWDADGVAAGNNATTGAGLGNSGSWDNGLSSNWWNGTTETTWTDTVSPDQDAVFTGAAGTVALSGTRTVHSLRFKTDGYSLVGGAIVWNSGGSPSHVVTVDNGTTTISGTTFSSGSLMKQGSGTLSLIAGAHVSGSVTVQDGALAIDSSAVVGPAPGAGASGLTLTTIAGNVPLFRNTDSTPGHALLDGQPLISLDTPDCKIDVPAGKLTFGGFISGVGLDKVGAGELEVFRPASSGFSFSTLIVRGGTYRGGETADFASSSRTLDGGTIGVRASVTFPAGSGIGVTSNGGGIHVPAGVTFVVRQVGGAGRVTLSGGGIVDGTMPTGGATVTGGTKLIATSASGMGPTPSMPFPDQLTLDNGSVQFVNDFASVNRGIRLGSGGGTIEIIGNSSATFTFAGILGGSGSLTKTGPAILLITGGNNSYSGATTVNNGTLRQGVSLTSSAAVTVNAGKLELIGGAGGMRVIKTPAVAVTGGVIDLSDNKLITATDVATITALIASGRNGGSWSGSGIVTSQTAATSSSLTSLGVARAQQVKALPGATATGIWAGQTVTGSDVLVMYTYAGDANLDGKLSVDDYGRIDSNIGLGTAGWYNGDFNYDGKVNVDDYGILDSNIGVQGAPFPTSAALSGGFAAVPEPAGGLLLLTTGCGGLAMGRRRRCRRPYGGPTGAAESMTFHIE